MKIIGLAGQAGAGKDHTFGVIRDDHLETNLVVVRVSFADGVREEIADVLQIDIDSDVLWTKPYPYEVRRLLQWWGTELRRAEDPDYWVKKGIAEAKRLASGETVHLVVITDVRFANEAEAIMQAGGLVYEIRASETVRQDRLGGILPPKHASEDIDFDVNGHIYNSNNSKQPVIPSDIYLYCGDHDVR